MTKDDLKEYILDKIDLLNDEEMNVLERFIDNNSQEEIAQELLIIKGEFKKLTKFVSSIEDTSQINQKNLKNIYSKQQIELFIDFYKFILNSKESMEELGEVKFLGILNFNKSFNEFKKGFNSIDLMYENVLKDIDLNISANIGDKFKSDFHEVVEVINDNNLENNIIVEVFEQGFIYKNKTLNYAKVKVNKWI